MVSVIVPVYNAARVLPRTLPGLLGQDHPVEILFVDDASTDETPNLLRQAAAGREDVRILTHATNRGRAAARNTGIAEATGEVLLFFDADVRPEPSAARAHSRIHQRAEVVGALSRSILADLDPRDPYHQYLRARGAQLPAAPGAPLPLKYFVTTFISVRAAAVREVGGFDEYLTYGEDLDFAYRLAQRYPQGLVYAPDAVVHHFDHGHLGDRLAKLRAFGRDNLPYLLDKHPGLARAADLEFVLSPAEQIGWRARLLRFGLRPRLGEALVALAPTLPSRLVPHVLRYVMAAEVMAAYTEGRRAPAPTPV